VWVIALLFINGENVGHRFDHREQAVLWAEAILADMERWDFDMPVAD
jgi:hypothetical protein